MGDLSQEPDQMTSNGMMILLKHTATAKQKKSLVEHIRSQGCDACLFEDDLRAIVITVDNMQEPVEVELSDWPFIERLLPSNQPFLLASRDYREKNTHVKVGEKKSGKGGSDVVFGSETAYVIAGPCAVEFESTTLEIARHVKKAGCRLFRGGTFKPRSSPYSFQGLGRDGLRILEKVRKETGLHIVTEVLEIHDLDDVAAVADVIQIGTRNMSNFNLLKQLGGIKKPVLLKRGMSSTIKEFLMAAEYILANGNPNVILCERGIRTFETYTRFNLDINAVPAIKELSHLPIIIDPSHATGIGRLVEPVALAGIAAGADGILMEVHTDPSNSFSDGAQAIQVDLLAPLTRKLNGVAEVIGRKVV